MKKALILLTIILLIVASSCKKNDSDPSPENLAGTKWISDDKESSIEFITQTQFQFIWTDYFNGGKYPQEENGIYTVDKNKIIFDFGDGDPMNGIIESNTITCVWLGDVIVVKKQ